MSLPRKHNLKQLKKLRNITKGKDIGDIVSKGEKNKESKMPNAYWMDNPFDRKIDTYENFIKENKLTEGSVFENDAEILWQNYLIQNEDFINKNYMNIDLIVNDIIKKNEYKDGIEYMKDDFYNIVQNYLDLELVEESLSNKGKGPGNTDLFNDKQFKQVLTSFKSPSILQIGKQVKVGKIKGYIDSVDNEFVYISTLDGNKEKISFKKFLKELELENTINENSGLPSEFWMDYQPEEQDTEIDVLEDEDEDEDEFEIEYDDVNNYKNPRKLPKPHIPNRINTKPSDIPRDFPREIPKIGSIHGTEDDPMGLKYQRSNENLYVNNYKGVKCDDCGEMVDNTYKSKVAHIYNKHFNKPEMDGSVPSKRFSFDTTWPQGGKEINKLLKKYFPKEL